MRSSVVASFFSKSSYIFSSVVGMSKAESLVCISGVSANNVMILTEVAANSLSQLMLGIDYFKCIFPFTNTLHVQNGKFLRFGS